MVVKKLKKKLLTKPVDTSVTEITPEKLLSSGHTLFNLCCTGKIKGAYVKGTYINLVGDSNTGKTVLGLTAFAEASINPNFDDYDFIHDNPEEGALMLAKFFGPKVGERIIPPATDSEGEPLNSETVDDFYDNLDSAISRGRPFIYLLDSMDILDTRDDIQKAKKQKSARDKGESAAGSYGTSKAKVNKHRLRKVIRHLKASGSILIIISQTIDKIGGFSFGGPQKTKAGGGALKFCAAYEVWMSHKSKITKDLTKNGKKKSYKVGILTKVRVEKNRVIGRDRTIEIPIYNSFGIDDLGSCIQYLLDEGHWKKNKSGDIIQQEFDVDGNKEDLISYIEESGTQHRLRKLVAQVWREIDRKISVTRKPKYL